MANNKTSKIKVLYLLKILQEETDAEHGVTMAGIIERLGEYKVSAERKSVYKDIKTLREFGVDVKTYQRNPGEYGLDTRNLSAAELMLIADAVQSCRAISDRQAKLLIDKVKTLAMKLDRPKLNRTIHVVGRVKTSHECVLKTVDAVHEAIRLKCKVSFVYMYMGADGKRRAAHQGEPRVVTPVAVSYDNGFYYLSAYSDEHAMIVEYRLDRMKNFAVLEDEPAADNDAVKSYKPEDGTVAIFGRFTGNEQQAVLKAAPSKLEIITDRFGAAVVSTEAQEDESALANVRVCVSQQFFGWVAGMGGAVTIAGPQNLVDEYRAYLRSLLEE